MSKLTSRLGVVALAIALVLVPTLARARQSVEHRDATRLSIKHSWVGVAPPGKNFVAPRSIVVLPERAPQPERGRVAARPPVVDAPAPHPVAAQSLDPLRGPPSTRLS